MRYLFRILIFSIQKFTCLSFNRNEGKQEDVLDIFAFFGLFLNVAYVTMWNCLSAFVYIQTVHLLWNNN